MTVQNITELSELARRSANKRLERALESDFDVKGLHEDFSNMQECLEILQEVRSTGEFEDEDGHVEQLTMLQGDSVLREIKALEGVIYTAEYYLRHYESDLTASKNPNSLKIMWLVCR